VRIEIGCGSDPAEMSGAWPAYRKLSGGRSHDGAGNRVHERVLDSRVKPAGVRNDHRRRKSGNASCDQLKKRPPVGDPRKLCEVFFTRVLVDLLHRRETARPEDQQDCFVSAVTRSLRRVRRTDGANRMFRPSFKDECEVAVLRCCRCTGASQLCSRRA